MADIFAIVKRAVTTLDMAACVEATDALVKANVLVDNTEFLDVNLIELRELIGMADNRDDAEMVRQFVAGAISFHNHQSS